MGNYIYINGKIVEKEKASISVLDHGLLYGDGVFEGIRAYGGKIFKLDEHIQRLYNSAKIIMLEIPLSRDNFKKAVISICKTNQIKDGYIRPIVTRGIGDLGLDPWKCKNPSIIIIADKIQLYPAELYDKGMSLITVPTRRNSSESINPIVKSLNYLNNIMAKIEGKNSGVEEIIMLNNEGYVAECSGDNIFMIQKNKIYMPPVIAGALPGITRDTVIEITANSGFSVEEKFFSRMEMFIADEVFLTGTGAEIVPVIKIDGRTIGKGKPGPITKDLVKKFKIKVMSEGTPIQ